MRSLRAGPGTPRKTRVAAGVGRGAHGSRRVEISPPPPPVSAVSPRPAAAGGGLCPRGPDPRAPRVPRGVAGGPGAHPCTSHRRETVACVTPVGGPGPPGWRDRAGHRGDGQEPPGDNDPAGRGQRRGPPVPAAGPGVPRGPWLPPGGVPRPAAPAPSRPPGETVPRPPRVTPLSPRNGGKRQPDRSRGERQRPLSPKRRRSRIPGATPTVGSPTRDRGGRPRLSLPSASSSFSGRRAAGGGWGWWWVERGGGGRSTRSLVPRGQRRRSPRQHQPHSRGGGSAPSGRGHALRATPLSAAGRGWGGAVCVGGGVSPERSGAWRGGRGVAWDPAPPVSPAPRSSRTRLTSWGGGGAAGGGTAARANAARAEYSTRLRQQQVRGGRGGVCGGGGGAVAAVVRGGGGGGGGRVADVSGRSIMVWAALAAACVLRAAA